MTTYNLMDGASGRPGTGSSGTRPPASGTAFSGNYIAGLVFQVTQGGLYLSGYRWYVAASGQDTGALKCALWNIYSDVTPSHAILNPAGTVTSGAFTAGQWNAIPLTAAIPLTPNIPYIAAIGGVFSTGFPDTINQFASGDPYASGITNGPLSAYSSVVAAAASWPQSPFSTAGSDPTTTVPHTNNHDDILWLDVTITDQAPAGATYRAWPNMADPWPRITTANDQTGYTLSLEFSLSQACTLSKIWHYSPTANDQATATVLPTRCLIWNVSGQSAVSGTDNQSPSWKDPNGSAASAGDGWVYCDYSASGVTLASGVNYKVSTFHAAGANWFGAVANVFGGGGIQSGGFTSGPLTIPNNANSSPGQQSWNTTTFGYPATSTNPEADWIDVEVTPAPAGPAYTAFMSSM